MVVMVPANLSFIRTRLLESVLAHIDGTVDKIIMAFDAGLLFFQGKFVGINAAVTCKLDLALDMTGPASLAVIFKQSVAYTIGCCSTWRYPIACALCVAVSHVPE